MPGLEDSLYLKHMGMSSADPEGPGPESQDSNSERLSFPQRLPHRPPHFSTLTDSLTCRWPAAGPGRGVDLVLERNQAGLEQARHPWMKVPEISLYLSGWSGSLALYSCHWHVINICEAADARNSI